VCPPRAARWRGTTNQRAEPAGAAASILEPDSGEASPERGAGPGSEDGTCVPWQKPRTQRRMSRRRVSFCYGWGACDRGLRRCTVTGKTSGPAYALCGETPSSISGSCERLPLSVTHLNHPDSQQSWFSPILVQPV
jgi:hypothetical protein